jgi:hypothetical protein
MDVYLFNDAPNHPVEFDIIIPAAANPATKAATLRMDVYDIDLPDEVDEVYVNGKKVGTLTGADGIWGVNYFDIPIGTLRAGRNRIKVVIDINNGGWATNIDWGIIKLSSQVTITQGWITPVRQKKGMFINLFATVSGKPAAVQGFNGTTKICDMSDPDGNGTWSCQYQIPTGWPTGWKSNIYIKAKNAAGGVLSQWPGVTVQ